MTRMMVIHHMITVGSETPGPGPGPAPAGGAGRKRILSVIIRVIESSSCMMIAAISDSLPVPGAGPAGRDHHASDSQSMLSRHWHGRRRPAA
jgi:hypothetical protein